MSYNGIVTKIESVRSHTNADRLQIASILGYQVIVSLDAKQGDIGILFPDDGQLSMEYATANNLIAGVDENGNKTGGYFDHNRRVRAQKLRGEKSEAYFAPLESLSFTGYDISKLNVGDRFNTLNDIPICNKYITKATQEAGAKKNKKGKEEKQFTKKFNQHLKTLFPEHKETDQFKHYADKIPYGSNITITSKFHGTSGRVSYIPVITKLNWLQSIANKLFFGNKDHYHYDYVHGSRRVILTKDSDGGYYKGTDFRNKCLERFKNKLNKNEIVFFEIVGYTDTGASIMPTVNTEKMKDKEFTKRFGKNMTYKYGCIEGVCEIYVYRMAIVNPDGHLEEMPWSRVKQRCNEMGIKHVVEIDNFVYTDSVDLKEVVEHLTDGVDLAEGVDESHIREGVCIRVDSNDGKSNIYKNKCFVFKVLEGICKDTGVVDMEEVESI